ncbi:MAG: ABC transporter permease [Tannerella sp.]|jgi:ABC-type antimicrobial peptide transport system permease subunit|nr:ABC transporter permease [Tannerella sp.]
MFHFKIILRNLRRGGIYSAINIGGLAIGMAAAILILAWIYHEWSYDRFHDKEKNLYVTYSRIPVDGSLQCFDSTPFPLGPTLKTDYPEMAGVARLVYSDLVYGNEDAKFRIRTGYIDTDFLTMFDFPLLYGNRETALNDPYSVILTEKATMRLFGKEDPMGKTVLVNNQYPKTVTGVMKDLPANTFFQFEALLSVPSRIIDGGTYNENWGSQSVRTFVELHPSARLDAVNESIRGLVHAHSNNTADIELFLHPLGKQHLFSTFVNGIPVGGGLVEQMRLFGLIAGLILLIACINFMNLSTARSQKRAKEVGVRKVMGGKRLSLIRLFLGESMMVSFIAGGVALVLALMVLPVFSALMGKQLSLNLVNGWFWVAGLGFVIFTGLLAGSYPAFYLSSFLPVKVLKGVFRTNRSSVSPRKVLVVVQFTVACALIVSTLVIHRQLKYAQNRATGYDKEQLVYVNLSGDAAKNYEIIKQELFNSGTALSVTKTSSPMSAGWTSTRSVDWQGKDLETSMSFDLYWTDADWAKTVGTTIIEGRDVDIYSYPTDSTAILLNETAVKIMNLEHPVGEIIRTLGIEWRVVGVVKDFILRSPYEPVWPTLIGGPAWGSLRMMHVKLNGHRNMADNLAFIAQLYKQYEPAFPFEYHFVDEEYARKFQSEQKMGSLLTWFAGLTIFISCMGLFALVAYMAETRRKEIGIRKVLGASVSDVVFLLSKEFLILVMISVSIASPVAWWAMSKWLSGYAYRTDIPWWLFIVVGIISLCIALLTVGFQAIRAAMANPVKAIKSE